MSSADPSKRHLLMTLTNEPFQPVRLYYSIPERDSVVKRLRALKCTVNAPSEQCWQWLFQAEAAPLRFACSYNDVPKVKRPIILGRIRFPRDGGMTLQTNSIADIAAKVCARSARSGHQARCANRSVRERRFEFPIRAARCRC
jgi:hypothetical protein